MTVVGHYDLKDLKVTFDEAAGIDWTALSHCVHWPRGFGKTKRMTKLIKNHVFPNGATISFDIESMDLNLRSIWDEMRDTEMKALLPKTTISMQVINLIQEYYQTNNNLGENNATTRISAPR